MAVATARSVCVGGVEGLDRAREAGGVAGVATGAVVVAGVVVMVMVILVMVVVGSCRRVASPVCGRVWTVSVYRIARLWACVNSVVASHHPFVGVCEQRGRCVVVPVSDRV